MNQYTSADLIQVAVARHYEQDHGASAVSIGNAPEWDIKFSDGFTVEVKVDALAAQYYNAAIEFWDTRRNKPTGILGTEAQIWLHCVPEGDALRCYELQTKQLLKLCLETGEVKPGGDNHSSLLKLIPMQKISATSQAEFTLRGDLVRFVKYW